MLTVGSICEHELHCLSIWDKVEKTPHGLLLSKMAGRCKDNVKTIPSDKQEEHRVESLLFIYFTVTNIKTVVYGLYYCGCIRDGVRFYLPSEKKSDVVEGNSSLY
jgi:hypothetical protein